MENIIEYCGRLGSVEDDNRRDQVCIEGGMQGEWGGNDSSNLVAFEGLNEV